MASTTHPLGRHAGLAFAVAPLIALGACSTGGQRLTRSGFLSDYSQMGPTKEHKKDAIYVAADYEPSAYKRVIVEPVEWYGPKRDEKTKDKLTRNFHAKLSRSLAGRYEVGTADHAGPGVLRVRSAITGARPARWYYNVPAQAAQLALGGIGLFRPSSGGASEEMQVQDSATGRPLIQVATFRNGKPWHVSGSYIPYDHARGSFAAASKLLTEVATEPATPRIAAASPTKVASVEP